MSKGRQLHCSLKQLQHAYKHAHCFGIAGPANKITLNAFRVELIRHVQSPDTQVIQGSFRGILVTHFLNVHTGVNVIRDSNGNFLSVWALSAMQKVHMLKGGKLGGGI